MLPGPFHPRFDDLPALLPLFPLPGALLLPGARMPLNIFEPRYLAMAEEALGHGRLMGMIQPRTIDALPGSTAPDLYTIGCAGRISTFAETDDGRLLITLVGVSRFRMVRELPLRRAFRSAEIDWAPFRADLELPPVLSLNRPRLMAAVASYVLATELPLNMRVLDDLDDVALIDSLAMVCPLERSEKQALLECPTVQERADTLLAILEMTAFSTGGADMARQ